MGTLITGCAGRTLGNLEQACLVLPPFRVSSLQYFENFSTRLSASDSILAIYHKERNSVCPQPVCFFPVCFRLMLKNRVGKGLFYISICQTYIISQFC